MPPVAFARAARAAGYSAIGLRLAPAALGALHYPMAAGGAAVAELRRVLGGEGLAVHDIEFVPIGPDFDAARHEALLATGAELGATCINVSGDDGEGARLAANFGAFCDLARPYGMRVELEFMRWRAVGRLEEAVATVAGAARENGRVLVDCLHLFRSGGSAAALAAVEPCWLGSVQLCDAAGPAPETDTEVIAEARESRLPPGAGVLPLDDVLAALGGAFAGQFGVELPMRGVPGRDRLGIGAEAARALLAKHQDGGAGG